MCFLVENFEHGDGGVLDTSHLSFDLPKVPEHRRHTLLITTVFRVTGRGGGERALRACDTRYIGTPVRPLKVLV